MHCIGFLKPQRIVFAISDRTNCFICPLATKTRIWLETQNAANPMNTLHLLASMDSYNSMVDYAINCKRQWHSLRGGWQCANERCTLKSIQNHFLRCSCRFALSLFVQFSAFHFSFFWNYNFSFSFLCAIWMIPYVQMLHKENLVYKNQKCITNSFHACALVIASQATHIHARTPF